MKELRSDRMRHTAEACQIVRFHCPSRVNTNGTLTCHPFSPLSFPPPPFNIRLGIASPSRVRFSARPACSCFEAEAEAREVGKEGKNAGGRKADGRIVRMCVRARERGWFDDGTATVAPKQENKTSAACCGIPPIRT